MALLAVAAAAGACRGGSSAEPRAVRGQFDLKGLEPDEGSVRLAGEWALRWQDLDAGGGPSDCGPPGAPYILVPGAWNGRPGPAGPLPGLGHATFALRVRLPDRPCRPWVSAWGRLIPPSAGS